MKYISFVKYGESIFIADAEDIREQITILEVNGVITWAFIELKRNAIQPFSWYIKNDFVKCSREEFLAARYKAQAATAEFFGYQEGYEIVENRFRDEE